MKYSIVSTFEAERVGIRKIHHNTNAKGDKMVVNENELRKVNPDIKKAAVLLGGEVLSLGEVQEQIKKWNDEQQS